MINKMILHLNRGRETCGSWLGPSYYFEVYNYEGNLVYKVEGPAGYPWECTRDSVAVFKVKQWVSWFLFLEIYGELISTAGDQHLQLLLGE